MSLPRLTGWIAALALTAVACSSPAPSQVDDPLVFTLGPVKRWMSPGVLILGYAVRNAGSESQYLAQHPGASTWIGCSTGNRGGIGGGAGVSSRDGDLPREYFLQLAPGEALLGEIAVGVSPDCLSPITVYGEYRADPDMRWGTRAKDLRLSAAPIEVPLPAVDH